MIPATTWEQAALTAGQVQVLRRLLMGERPKDIAQLLGKSAATVHDHVQQMHRAVGSGTTAQLVLWALREKRWVAPARCTRYPTCECAPEAKPGCVSWRAPPC